jgi:hypothetical protein
MHQGRDRWGCRGFSRRHGKVGAAAGCVIGHHEANKAATENAKAQAPISALKRNGKN